MILIALSPQIQKKPKSVVGKTMATGKTRKSKHVGRSCRTQVSSLFTDTSWAAPLGGGQGPAALPHRRTRSRRETRGRLACGRFASQDTSHPPVPSATPPCLPGSGRQARSQGERTVEADGTALPPEEPGWNEPEPGEKLFRMRPEQHMPQRDWAAACPLLGAQSWTTGGVRPALSVRRHESTCLRC